MATVVGAPAGTSDIAGSFNRAGQGFGSIIAGLAQRQQKQKRQQDLQLLMQTLNPQPLEQNTPGVGPPAPQPQIDLSQLGGLQTPGFQNLASQMLVQQAFKDEKGGFSLGQGDRRFDRSGKLIASGPSVPTSATQQIAQSKLDGINALKQKKADGTITSAEAGLLEKATFGGGGINIDLSSGQLLTAATSLRKEFNTDQRVKDFRILAPKFKNMLSFIDRSQKTGRKGPTDIALSKTFQKLTDLMSSVREGEYETTFRGQSLLGKLRGGIKKLKEGGEGMTPEFRQELVDTARLMFNDGKLFFNQAIEEKGSVADAFNIPRGQILGNIKPFEISDTGRGFEDIFGINQDGSATDAQRTNALQQGSFGVTGAGITRPNTVQGLDSMSIEQMQSLLPKQ